MSPLGTYAESWFAVPTNSNPYMRTYRGNLSRNVPARSFAPCPSVAAPEIPLREMGWKIPARQMRQTVRAPQTPLRELGWHALAGMGESAPQAVASTAPIDAAVVTTSIASEAAAGSTMAAWAGPIGAAVGLVIGLIAGFWSAHEARAKGATTENAAVNSAVTAFDQSIKAIFAAANSTNPAQQITASEAEQLCTQVLASFWQGMAPYQVGPGRADQSHGGTACGGVSCNKACTAGCCVGCLDIAPSVQSAIAVFQAGGGSATMLEVYGSSYGAVTRPAYSLTYTAPAPASAPAAAVDSVASALTNLFSPSTPAAPAGTTLTPTTGSTEGLSLFVWAGLGLGALLLFKAVSS